MNDYVVKVGFMDDKERLRQALLLDMKHWSADTLKIAINYIDGMVLSVKGEDFLWWWELRKKTAAELEARRQSNEVPRSLSGLSAFCRS